MSRGGAFDSLFCPEGRGFVHNDFRRGRVFAPFESCPGLPVIKYKDEIWVKAKTVANTLRYKNTIKSIRDHVDPEDKRRLSELGPKSKHNETLPLEIKAVTSCSTHKIDQQETAG